MTIPISSPNLVFKYTTYHYHIATTSIPEYIQNEPILIIILSLSKHELCLEHTKLQHN
jgi:hypothetical protein